MINFICVNGFKKGRKMNKTILLIVAALLLFSLCGTGDSYAVSAKKMKKLARKAEEAIVEAQAYVTKWESAGYPAPKAKDILEKARRAYKASNYKEARKLAEKSLEVSSDKGLKKKAQKAQKTIAGAQAYITKWESVGYATPRAKEILEKARRTYGAGNYEEARKLAEESLYSLKVEVRAGPAPRVEFHLDPDADLNKYKRIAVPGFNDAPDAPGSGKIIADLISSGLTGKGYKIVGRAKIEAMIGEQKLEAGVIHLGRMMGTDAVITGTLSQYGSIVTQHRGVAMYGVSKTRPVYSAIVEVTVQMLDTKTGSTIWQGSGSFTSHSLTIQPVAQAVIKAILDELSKEKTQ